MAILTNIRSKWKIASLLIGWFLCATGIWYYFSPRPFVIENVAQHWVSDDGSLLATCSMETATANAKVVVWDLRTLTPRYEVELPPAELGYYPRRAAFSPSGKSVWIGSQLLDLTQQTSRLSEISNPQYGVMPAAEVLFDEQDHLIARWHEEYWDVATMKRAGAIALPEEWDTYVSGGDLHIYLRGDIMTIVNTNRKTTAVVPRVKNLAVVEDGIGVSPCGRFYGHFGPANDYWLFSTAQNTPRKIRLHAEYDSVEISPGGTYLFAGLQRPERLLDPVWDKLQMWDPNEYHLIDPATGKILATVPVFDCATPLFAPNNSHIFASDHFQLRLSVWALPLEDRTLCMIAALAVASLFAGVAAFRLVKART